MFIRSQLQFDSLNWRPQEGGKTYIFTEGVQKLNDTQNSEK